MSFGFKEEQRESNGEVWDRLKFNAKTGVYTSTIFNKEEGQKESNEVNPNFKCYVDFAKTLKVGWADFSLETPSVATTGYGESVLDRPTPEHKEYVSFNLYNKELGMVNFGSSSKAVLIELGGLHDSYLSLEKEKGDLIPVVHFDGTKEIKFGKANKIQVPNVSIVDWRERPPTMLGQAEQVEEKKPEPVKAPEPDFDDDLDF
tara:strand:+ start:1475 stop:2083 length:609 start_codon:yes stop_codon:yes gene_type:complete